jgi:hypothetical protein
VHVAVVRHSRDGKAALTLCVLRGAVFLCEISLGVDLNLEVKQLTAPANVAESRRNNRVLPKTA